jgi:hypothetical protein
MAPLENHEGHFDEMTCLLYLDGQLDRGRAAELARHVGECPACRKLLTALEEESELLRGALTEEEEAVPARLLTPPAEESVPWGWLTGLGLAGAGTYTLWSAFFKPLWDNLSMAGLGPEYLGAMLMFGGAFWKGWDSVMNLMNVLAVGTLGVLLVMLVRRAASRSATLAMVMAGVAAILSLPPAVAAAEIKKGESYTLPAGETIKSDLYLFGGSVRIDGTVEGDLIVFCESLNLSGRVTGDVIFFGKRARVDGQVDGDVRGFGNDVAVAGTVAKNFMVFGEMLTISPKAQVGGSATLFGASMDLDGRVARDLLAHVAKPRISGFVGGSAEIHAHQLAISSGAEIQGKVRVKAESQPNISSQAKFGSGAPEVEIIKREPPYLKLRFYRNKLLKTGAAFVLGLILYAFIPAFMNDTVKNAGRYGSAFGYGALTLFATPILAIVACFTVVGIAPALVAMLLWIILLYAGQIALGGWIGQRALGVPETFGGRIGRLALGLLVIRILGNLPYVDDWVWVVVAMWGMGALVYTAYKRLRPDPVYVPSEPAPLPSGSA